jgi:hypothetical protein
LNFSVSLRRARRVAAREARGAVALFASQSKKIVKTRSSSSRRPL